MEKNQTSQTVRLKKHQGQGKKGGLTGSLRRTGLAESGMMGATPFQTAQEGEELC